MKKRLLALLLALCMVLTMAPAVFAADSDNPALPDAKVTELDVKAISEAGGPELTFAMNFTASEPSPDTLAYYGSWYADFVLTINKDVTFNSDTTSGAGGYLAGQYDIAGPNWYVVPPKDVQYPANTPFKIMEYAFETMGEENFQLTYNDVCSFVQNFDCGIFFTKDFLDAAENQDLKVTLELIIYEPNNEYSYRIGPAYVFEPGKKVQEITLSSETETPSITKKGTYSAAGITDSPLIVNPGKDENVTLKLEGVEIYAGNMNSQVMFAAEGAMVAADEGDKVTTSAIEILSGNVTIDVADYENVLLGGENGAGIYVAEGASLTIVGNEGTLTAIGNNGADASDSGAAGIGGTKTNGNSGAITIDGAKVEARGYGVHGSGIGSGSGKVVGEIKIINGADVTAYGGYYADGAGTLLQSSYGKSDPEGGVGIGGGGKTVSTIADITIKDSKVTAYGGSKAAGIGSNFWSSCGKITIDNSTVIAQGGSSSAAIGTSRAGDNGVTANIDIKNKSNVTAKGGAYGAGIGGGYNNDSLGNGADASALPVTYIKIADSTINAAGGEGGAGIGGGYKTDNVDIDITGGNVTASAGALVSGKTVANGGAACAIGSGANGSGVFENSPEVELSGTYSVDATAYYGGKDAIEGVDTSTDTNVELTLIGQPGDTSWYDESKTEFTITTRDQLYGFADLVNSGVTFAGKTVKLAADIDLTGKVWTPIGTSIYDKNPSTADVKMFAGNFDGGNHTITGLSSDRYVPASSETASTEYSFGLFGYVYGANISNVKLANVDIDGTTRKDSAGNDVGGSGVAALIGYYYVENDKASVIENCHVLSGTVKASNNMGGLIGFIDSQKTTPQKVNITIKNCSNAADVTSEAREAGGIVGLLNASRDDYSPTMAGTITFKDCVNSGDITTLAGGGSTFAGGILGKDQNEYSNQQLKIIFDGCTNSGTITVEARGETHVAGIGTSFYSHGAWLVVKDSRNEGAIVVKNPENASPLYAGGLLGYAGVMDVLNSTSAGTVATGGGKYIGDVQNMVFVDAISDFNTINTGDVYYLNGGTSPEFEALVDDIAIWGGNFIVVKTAYKDGFDFGGWYDNKTYTGSPVTTLSEGSNLYYAKWSATLPGSGTEEDPYLIKNLTDLIIFRENVNYGNTYEGKYVSLDADIDLDGINWIPIGNDTNYFCGIFNGQDHIIKNMSIKANTPEANQFAGLFGGIKKATVKNLVMENVKIDVVGAKVRAAAVVGIAHSNSENRTDAKIFFENITVKGCDIKAESKAGSNMAAAIAAYCYPANHKNISVSDLTINGAANTGETSYLGGLVGYQQGQNISNNGNTRAAIEIDTFNLKNITINSKSNSVLAGGYAGYTYYGFITLKNGTVNGIKMNIDAGEALVGGMVGMTHRSDKGHTFADIDIKGIDFDVTTDYHGETRVGGMVGYSESPMAYTDCTTQGTIVEKCSDSANPVNHHAKVGGFVGRAYTWAQTFTNCTADVDVTSSHVAGGFVGNHITNAQYTNCEAKGDVKAHIAGGFAGILTKHNYSADVTFDGCKSSGNVEGNVVAGGFIGSTVSYGWADWGNADTKSPYAKNVTIKDCDVSGTVARTGGETAYVAGVVGEAIVADGVNITLNNVTYDVEPACYPAVASSSWYDENATEYHIKTHSDLIGFAELVDSGVTFEGKTVYLDNDIDLKNELFNPIGSYRHDKSFKGTFDGQNHSIKNLSQNTWELDNGYYYGDLGLGLFGLVEDATIKNLVMDGASISGESAICGTVAACAYGNCVFENIVVKNAEVADYQYYAGGLVGWASGDHEYINCDIDKSTTVAAQWGDFDNSTGGVIGGCGGSATIYMEDCDVACRLDVYNDVTSTYQWYAYRRCGMLVGNTGKTVTEDGTTYASAPQITAKNCTVTYGDWAVYTYCEFAGKSWPYVRAQAGISNSAYSNPRYGHPTDANGNEVVDDNHVHNDGEDHAILCIFDQLYGGGQGVYGEPAHEGVKVIYEWPVAENKDTDRVYATLASAIADAKDGETVVLLKNIDLTENDRIYGADRNVLVDVASGKDITLDMNSKKISVVHEDTFTNDYIVAVIRVADGAGLTVTGNGTIDVKANTNDPDIAYMFWKRGTTGHLTIENGTYHMNDSADSIVYTNGDEIVNIKGGTWTLDSVGTGENRSPWIFNVSGAGDNQVVVTGGTFNDNIQRQHWANEVMVPETYYVEKNDDNTWTVKSDAALYANEGILTGPYYVENWNIGYKSFDAFLEAANASDTDTIDLYDSITLLKDVVINVPLTNLDFNQNKHVVTIAENGSLTVRDAFTVSPVAAEGFILVTTENADGTVTYSVNGVYTVTFDAAGGSDVAPQTVNHGEKAVEPKEPTKSGFTFLGWTLDGAAYDFADAVTGNITLVASWAKNATEMEMYSVYKVEHYLENLDGTYTIVAADTKMYSAKVGSKVSATANTYDNYVVASADADVIVEKAAEGQDGKPVVTTLAVYYDLKKHTVTFNSAGGTAVAPQTVKHGDTAIEPKDPTNDGNSTGGTTSGGTITDELVFLGWYDKDGNPFDFDTKITGNITLTAKWAANSQEVEMYAAYKVEHYLENLYGGYTLKETEFPLYAEVGTEVSATAKTYDNYTTAKIDTDVVVEMPVADATTGEPIITTLKVYYDLEKYTVTFDTDGGSTVAAQTVKHGGVATAPTAPTKDGYTFAGWYLNGATAAYDFATVVTDDVTLEAKWTANGYVVTFDANGGSTVAEQVVEFGNTATVPTAPTKEGYTFAGWNLENGAAYDFTDAVTGDIKLVAEWTINEYTVTFNSAGGTAVAPQTVKHGDTAIEPKDPTNDGNSTGGTTSGGTITDELVFLGWYDKDGNPFDFGTKITGNITLTAKWAANSQEVEMYAAYKVEHWLENLDGSYTLKETEFPLYAEVGTEVSATAKTYDNYVVASADADVVVEMPVADATTGEPIITTLKVYYDLEKYDVVFDTVGGSTVAAQTVKHGGVATAPTAPTKDGYTFAGWNLENGAAYDFATVVTGGVTLEAKWTANGYVVKFDTNGGSAVDNQVVSFGNTATKPADPTKVGYTFAGWNLENGAAYDFTDAVTGNIKLVAEWTINEYTVSFDAAGGSTVSAQTVNHGEKAVEPKEPTKEGFTFLGWYLNGATTAYDFADAVTGNITLVASWAKNATEMEMYSVYKVEHYLENLDGTYTIVDADTKMYSAKVGSKVSATANTYDNYVVAEADADVIVEKAVAGQDGKPIVTTLEVYYDLEKYTVTFNSAGGTNVAPQIVKHGDTAIEPKDPTYGGAAEDDTAAGGTTTGGTTTGGTTTGGTTTGGTTTGGTETGGTEVAQDELVFIGWYLDGKLFDFDTEITEDITLTAKWAANATEMEMYSVYKVEHYLENLDGTYTLKEEEFPLRAKVGDKVTAKAKTYENYKLASADANVVVEKAAEGQDGKPVVTTLAVYYDLNEYTVSFDTADGSNVASQTVKHGGTAIEPKDPTNGDLVFMGWYNGKAEYDFSTAVTGDITLTAKWAANAEEMEMYSVYKVEHYLENLDGTYTIVDADTKMYSAKVGSKVSATANTYDNYVVASADADVIVEKAAEGQDGKPVVTTLAVYYDLNKYTVTFNSAGGSAVAPQTVKHGGTAIEPKDPTNGDLVFMGWYNGKAEYDFADAVTGDITLTAKWAANAEEMEMYTVYKVEHWLIDIDGEYSLADEEFPLRAKVGEIVSAEVKTYEDYVLVSADKNVIVEKAVAGEDGKPVVTTLYVYYEYAFEPGDANHDGYVDSTDAVLILRHLAGYELEVYYEDTADFNRDGEDDSTDAVGILRKLAGLR